ncbi:hypothetical protein A9Q86_12590 [Flavobacteriales bacterium 33_180_T64]|nr:hypothetical protein A9Q86_12590 [Flavobacteriales bacterium 33_180_T64]
MKNNNLKWNTSGDSEFKTSEWMGAIVRYFFFLGTKKFDTLYKENQIWKNALVGWLFKVILLLGVFYLALVLMNSN